MNETQNTKTTPAPEQRKNVQVSATVPAEIADVLEDHRWNARLTMNQLVRKAVDEYLDNHGLVAEPKTDAAKKA